MPAVVAGLGSPRVVADVMARGVVSAHEGALYKEIAAAMARNHVSTVPVLDDQRRVVGVVSAADLLARLSYDRGQTPRGHRINAMREIHRKRRGRTAAELMTSPAATVRETTTIRAAAERAGLDRVSRLPVVDSYGVLVGIVSKTDLLRYYLRDDREIAREVEQRVLAEVMALDPGTIDVEVSEGVVRLAGHLESRSVADQLVWQVREVRGVVDVDDALTYDNDEAPAR